MPLTQKQLQKKQQKKKMKRSTKILQKIKPPAAISELPVYGCYVPDNLWEAGIGNLVIAKLDDKGKMYVAIFLVDTYCLGIKDCYHRIIDPDRLEVMLESMVGEDAKHISVPESEFKALIKGAQLYAEKLGFGPKGDYAKANRFLHNISYDPNDYQFNFGKDGKPLYFLGPHDNFRKQQAIIDTLEKNCGAGNFSFIALGGET